VGDDYKLMEAKECALKLFKMGFKNKEAIRELGRGWIEANTFRKMPPACKDLLVYGSIKQSDIDLPRPVSMGSSWTGWDEAPDYMQDG
jgi:hypothetical protein